MKLKIIKINNYIRKYIKTIKIKNYIDFVKKYMKFIGKYTIYIFKLVKWNLKHKIFPVITKKLPFLMPLVSKKKAYFKKIVLIIRKLIKKIIIKIKEFKKENPKEFLAASIFLIILIINIPILIWYIKTPKPAGVRKDSKKSEYIFAASNSLYKANFGSKENNQPIVKFSIDGNSISFKPASGKENPEAPVKEGNQIVFKDIYKNIDYKYQTIKNGIKEDIVINSPTQIKTFPFFLEFKGAEPKYLTNIQSEAVFYDADGNYLFHFQKPYAIDASNQRTEDVGIIIKKDTVTHKYVALISIDPDWSYSPERVYPITIDPTIVHDESSEFTGSFNRVKDTGSGSSPNLETNYQELPADVNTVGLWHMDEGTEDTCSSGKDICDKSANMNDGHFSGMAFTSNAKIGNYATISDGVGDGIDIGDVELTNGKQLTVEAWFKLNSLTEYESIIAKNSSNYAYALQGDTVTGILRFWVSNANYTTDAESNTNVADGQWHHAAGVYDGTLGSANTKLYIDGVLQSKTANQTINIPNTTDQLCFGEYDVFGSGSIDGSIDEIRISNIARSPEEIKLDAQRRPYSIYTSDVIDLSQVSSWNSLSWTESGVTTDNGETVYNNTGLIAQWNFNETSGTTANNDAEGSSCGGTPVNCDGTLTTFASTASQDQAAGTGWTINNKRWGAGGLMFDGTNDTVIAAVAGESNFDFERTSPFSASAWIKTSSNSVFSIVNKLANSAPYTGYEFYMQSTGVIGILINNTYSSNTLQVDTYQKINDGNWHNVAVTYNGNSLANGISIYIDGKSVALNTLFNSLSASVLNNINLHIGSRNNTTYYLNGVLDSVSIYSRTLTATEILSNYNSSNIEFQTRVGSSSDPNDGTWEAWSPTTGETSIDNMDNPLDWATPSASIFSGVPIATSSSTIIKAEGNASLKTTLGSPVASTNTVALWHLDETSGTGAYLHDSTSGNYDLTPTGSTLSNGFYNKARTFNGSSDYATNTSLSMSSDLTIQTWFKTSTTPVDQKRIIDLAQAATIGLQLCMTATGTIGIDNSGGPTTNVFSTNTYSDGRWHHFAITRSSTTYTVYVDGASIGTSGGTAPTYTRIFLGRRSDTSGSWAGSLDEVKLDNTALSAEKLAEAYRAGRDHRITKTISSTNLSSSNKIPFYIASDRQGTFLETTIGESAFANYLPDSNTVGLWHLDEQTGTANVFLKDSSGNNYNSATITGTTFVQGKIGKARNFNGSSYVDFSSPIIPAGAKTVSFWMNTTSAVANQVLLNNNRGTTAANGVGYWLNNCATNKLRIFHTYNSSGNYNYDICSNASVNDGKWHLITNTWDGLAGTGNAKLYIDGVLDNTYNVVNTTTNTPTDNLRMGAMSGTLSYYYNGTIDEVRTDNSVRTADQIRQAYEVGLRTHSITIDFKAKLDSGNLISDTSDTSFTIDSTAYGASGMGSNLYKGDKIIVRENVDGTEYIAQGTVTAVTLSTGATTIASWDTGSTVPSSGFTVNATVFKWQKEYFDITKSLSTHRDAITNLTLRVIDGSQGANVWLDDFKYNTGNLTTPAGSTITSSTENRYFQYRSILTSNDPAVSSSLSMVTLDYESNHPPDIPTISTTYLHDKIKIPDTTPEIRFSGTDYESEDLTYQIVFDTDSSFPSPTLKTSDTDTGFVDITDGGDTDPFNSGDIVSYIFQDELTNDTIYYYKIRAKDPAGSNTYGEYSSIQSFTIDTSLNQNGWSETHADQFSTDTLSNVNVSTYNNNVYLDSGSGTITSTAITAVNIDSGNSTWGTLIWNDTETNGDIKYSVYYDDSGSPAIIPDGVLSGNSIGFDSSSIDLAGISTTTYPILYLRASLTYSGGSPTLDDWAIIFNNIPTTPSLDFPTDTETIAPFTTELKTTSTDSNSDYLHYKIILCRDSLMTTNCDTFDQTISQEGWSGQDAESDTAYSSGTQAVYTQTNLDPATTYYWKSYAIDPGGTNIWSSTQESPYSFTTPDIPNQPTGLQTESLSNPATVTDTTPEFSAICNHLEEGAIDESSLILLWDDKSSSESQYRIERNVNGAGFSFLINTLTDSTSYEDTGVTLGSTYQYRVRAEGSSNSEWCTTTTINLTAQDAILKGLNIR